MSAPLNLVGPLVRALRDRKGWTQLQFAEKLQLESWDVSRESVGKLEAQLRRVPDCELLYLSKVLGVRMSELFPRNFDLRKHGPSLRMSVSTKSPRKQEPRN